MADEISRQKQFDYNATSNLVIQSQRRRKEVGEGTGEVGPLSVASIRTKMGDRAITKRSDDPEFLARLENLRKRKKESESASNSALSAPSERPENRKRKSNKAGAFSNRADIVAAADEIESGLADVMDNGLYQPTTKVTRLAYDQILAFVQRKIGDQPRDLLHAAANELLSILKNERLKDVDRKKEVQLVLAEKISDEDYSNLSTFGRQIKDFDDDVQKEKRDNDLDNDDDYQKNEDGALDQDLGVAVVFDDEDEDQANDDNVEVLDESESGTDDDEDQEETDLDGKEQARYSPRNHDVKDNSGLLDKTKKDKVSPHEIDGYWLQRQLSVYYSDPVQCQTITEEVFSILTESNDDRERENRLVLLLDFERFELIKLVMKNRPAIVFCTRLAKAEGSKNKDIVMEEMKNDPEGILILKELQSSDDAIQLRVKNLEKSSKGKGANVPMEISRKTELHKLDLESLAFSQGSHVMSNKHCELPKGSVRIQQKDYEEVHVPALRNPSAHGEANLIPIKSLPEWTHAAFGHTRNLNRVQSEVYPTAFNSNENMLLCAPTGAGKTNVAVLTILRAISNAMDRNQVVDLQSFKVVYIAPMKALVSEVVNNLGERLKSYGIVVRELTGDINLTQAEIAETQVIVSTPEKWDIITRKCGERAYTALVKLLIIDEIHLLHDSRGPVLEAISARTIRSVESTAMETRIVGLSATLPNYEDVAAFLRVNPATGLFHFDNTYRPCPLQQQYIGITTRKALRRFQLMNEITWTKVKEQVKEQSSQVIVFVHSRKETVTTAKHLRDEAIAEGILDVFLDPESASAEVINTELGTVKSTEVGALLQHGFGVHHAGLTRSDRALVEDLFADGHIKVLVSTATLAWGVNLPAHAVIIKGTQVYSPEKGSWTELSSMDVMQMMGRAGRPQFDTHGEGIIITTHNELQYYLSLLNQQLPIESQLISNISDMLNAEIVLGTISNLDDAATWLTYTYLFIRMIRNPSLYGVSESDLDADVSLEHRRLELVHSAFLILDRAALIRYDRRSGHVQETDLGRVAAYYYISHKTMTTFAENLKSSLNEIDLLRVFSLSGEFEFMRVREEEKLELQRLMERVPIPIKDSMDDPAAKVNVLLQSHISNMRLDGLALTSDKVYVTQSAGRLARALFEIVLRRRWSYMTDRCLLLCKMISRQMWSIQTPLRQFSSVLSEDVLKKVERKDIDFERYYDLSASEIGELIRSPKLGKTVHKLIHYLPRMEIAAHVQPITRSTLKFELTLMPDFKFEEKVHGAGEAFWVFVEDTNSEFLLHTESFYLRKSLCEDEHTITFTVPISEPLPPHYFVRCVSDRWIVPESVLPVSFRRLILPGKFPPHTELLDLQPLTVEDAFCEFENGTAEGDAEISIADYFRSKIHTFNPVQTQVFSSLYKADVNCLIASPGGSGRLEMAELALARLFITKSTASAVYIVSKGTLLENRRVEEFQKGIGGQLGIMVTTLSGETSIDLKLLDTPGVLVVSTPEKWDQISRRWKQRRAVRNISLFIIEDLHLLGGTNGPIIEVICSRLRYINAQAELANKKICRIVALSDPIANARDLGDWLGVSSVHCYSFHPNARPIPLDTHIQVVNVAGSSPVAAMARPIYSAICTHASYEPVVIFVSSRRMARATAFELLTSTGGEKRSKRFLHASESDIAPLLDRIQTPALLECLGSGVAYFHESLPAIERTVVEKLFSSGAIQVLVTTPSMAWSSGAVCGKLVIIAGTAEEESVSALTRNEYPLSEIMHMLGKSGRPGDDTTSTAVILTTVAQRDYYRKFLAEPLPVESHVDHVLGDQLNAEIAAKVIQTKQDAVDYLTWTLFYRRLPQNPNYYNLTGATHSHISDHLSELIETALTDLEACKCVAAEGEEDMALGPLNLGMIASYYYIKYSTIELFSSTITAKTKLRGLLEVLAAALEYDDVPIRLGDDEALRKLAAHSPITLPSDARYSDPHVKAHLLLQSHFSRTPMVGDLAEDREWILSKAINLIQAMVDVISSAGWLKPALAAMELSQMIIQGMWDRDSALLQLPHIDQGAVKRLNDAQVENIFDLIELEDDERNRLLMMDGTKLSDIARACNMYPSIELSYDVEKDTVMAGTMVNIQANLKREVDENESVTKSYPVHCPRYPSSKDEGWWAVIGDADGNTLYSIKRVMLKDEAQLPLNFNAPDVQGKRTFKLYLMSDSYLGCDQEENIVVNIVENNAQGQEGEPEGEDVEE